MVDLDRKKKEKSIRFDDGTILPIERLVNVQIDYTYIYIEAKWAFFYLFAHVIFLAGCMQPETSY